MVEEALRFCSEVTEGDEGTKICNLWGSEVVKDVLSRLAMFEEGEVGKLGHDLYSLLLNNFKIPEVFSPDDYIRELEGMMVALIDEGARVIGTVVSEYLSYPVIMVAYLHMIATNFEEKVSIESNVVACRLLATKLFRPDIVSRASRIIRDYLRGLDPLKALATVVLTLTSITATIAYSGEEGDIKLFKEFSVDSETVSRVLTAVVAYTTMTTLMKYNIVYTYAPPMK